ncbi:MAG TPA: thioredoxin fold domain-containing protein [Candidatus Bathyarchaeia archaeon]|nr:thioredoxin fold domain-containing protein [Candidatus Bathyarchaeia archaeon]
MKKTHILLIAALCIALAAGCGGNGGSKDSEAVYAASEAKMWLSFNDGMALAAKEQKHVVIDFYTSWCHWCKVMDKETFSNAEVKKFLAENFVTIRVDAESKKGELIYKGATYTPVELARKFGVRGYPSLAYLDRKGELVQVIPGYWPAKNFLPLLHYMEKECYTQKMTFEEFMKKGDCDSTRTTAM